MNYELILQSGLPCRSAPRNDITSWNTCNGLFIEQNTPSLRAKRGNPLMGDIE